MVVVVCYDVVDNKKRYRLAKLMKNYGSRVQKSVFECTLDERQYLTMKQSVEKLIDWELDSVRYYSLCRGCLRNVEISGLGIVTEDEDVMFV